MHHPERIGSAHAGENRNVPHNRKHLAGHFDDDLVGVTVRHEPGQGSATGHAKAARIVDHNQVRATGLSALRRDAGPGSGTEYWDSTSSLIPEPLEYDFPRDPRSVRSIFHGPSHDGSCLLGCCPEEVS